MLYGDYTANLYSAFLLPLPKEVVRCSLHCCVVIYSLSPIEVTLQDVHLYGQQPLKKNNCIFFLLAAFHVCQLATLTCTVQTSVPRCSCEELRAQVLLGLTGSRK